MVLIVICGTDGSGKGTQVRLLVKRLEREGVKVRIEDFPRYEEPSSWFVREYLNGRFGSAGQVNAYCASLFYALDRYAASFGMKDFLADGGVVVCNRYVSANKGHQLGKIKGSLDRDKYLAWLDGLEYGMLGNPKEDLNILLYMPPEVGQQLVDKKDLRSYTEKKRDIHEADLQHLQDAADAYLYVARKEGWTIIECVRDGKLLSIDEIHELVYARVKSFL